MPTLSLRTALILGAVAACVAFGAWAARGHYKPALDRLAAALGYEHAGRVLSDAEAGAAKQAVGVIDRAAQRSLVIVQTQQENRDAILSAPGADAPVDPGLGGLWTRGLCRYAVYAADPGCRLPGDGAGAAMDADAGGRAP